MRFPTPFAAALVAVALASSLSAARAQESGPFATVERHRLASGTFTNDWATARPVDRRIVTRPGAASLRLFFDEIDVGAEGSLVVTSLRDGERHVLTPTEVVKWGATSGFLNGDAVSLELWLGPGERGSYVLDRLLAGTGGPFPTSICGVDDRIPSTDNRSVRMLNGSGTSACSGWLVSTSDCVFSAGHCMPTYANVAEVNVPPSLPSGALVHPPLQDQFPVDAGSLTFTSGGVGNDWGVARLFSNNLGQSASALHGLFQLATFVPTSGQTTRITGYGSDTGTSDQTNQTHTGPFHSSSGTAIRYTVDTTGGNSGSVVIDEASGLAVGIHTHGGCSSSGGYNSGTTVTHPALQSAFSQNCSQGPPAADFTLAASIVAAGSTVSFADLSGGVPTSWAWDLDGDGLTDSTSPNPSFLYGALGSYDVTLTVSNAFGTASSTVADAVTVLAPNPVTPPYLQTFASGLPADGSWSFTSSTGLGALTTGQSGGASPQSGGPGLLLASTQDATYATNEATFFFALDPTGAATLRFQFKEFGDEDDPQDGVFLSDGASEVLLQSFNAGPSSWTTYTLDLGAAVVANGLNPTALRVIFRQRDNYPIPTDGHAIDDVELLGQGTACPAPTTYGVGEIGSTGATAQIGHVGGDPKAGNTEFAITLAGAPAGASAVLFTGSAQASSAQPWGTILVGGSPFTRTWTVTDAGGAASIGVPIVAGLIGQTRTFQYAIRDPGFGGNVQGSNGLQVTFCP
ncbi:MAG: PKD domain-containing protein [Planctomycetota bacterium JB042]